jgi:hypothetical protein
VLGHRGARGCGRDCGVLSSCFMDWGLVVVTCFLIITVMMISPVSGFRPVSAVSRQAIRYCASMSASEGTMTKTGAFKNILTEIHAGPTLYKLALKSLSHVKADETIKNVRNKHRKLSAQSLDAVMKGLTVPITRTLESYDIIFRRIHPYEASWRGQYHQLLELIFVITSRQLLLI